MVDARFCFVGVSPPPLFIYLFLLGVYIYFVSPFLFYSNYLCIDILVSKVLSHYRKYFFSKL